MPTPKNHQCKPTKTCQFTQEINGKSLTMHNFYNAQVLQIALALTCNSIVMLQIPETQQITTLFKNKNSSGSKKQQQPKQFITYKVSNTHTNSLEICLYMFICISLSFLLHPCLVHVFLFVVPLVVFVPMEQE